MARKRRNEVPRKVAARVMFLSDRTCCVCREAQPVQIHHIDENPSNSEEANLAVLCFNCHHETQLRGGFGRKLDAQQILLYRKNWYATVRRRRSASSLKGGHKRADNLMPEASQVTLEKQRVQLSYLKLTEIDKKHRYSFNADYPQIAPAKPTAASEANLLITAFVTRELQGFRSNAKLTSRYKAEALAKSPALSMSWDDMSIGHSVGHFTKSVLAIDFRISCYGAGAAHPNHHTKTLNFDLRHPTLLEQEDLFKSRKEYLSMLSNYCIRELRSQRATLPATNFDETYGKWILQGAGPEQSNFERFLIVERGLRIFFDEYSVGPYAEGRHEVFVPLSTFKGLLREGVEALFA